MKVTPEHLTTLRDAVRSIDTEQRRDAYRAGSYPRAHLTKDVDKRYRWDLFWRSGAYDVLKDGDYLDAHIDTALRSIVAPL